MTEYPQGSEWRKWDLHIHTPLSILNNQFSQIKPGQPDWEVYLSRLESCDVAVIGVTDYFTIEGYKRLKDFKAQGRLPNISAIFPNIEFRLSHVLSSKKDSVPRRLNFHVIFSIDPDAPEEMREVEAINDRLVHRALAMDGTCTGEHGIGLHKMGFLLDEAGAGAVEMMRTIKHALDPKNIMNPGKIFSA